MPVANRSGPEPYLSIRTKFFDDAIVAAVRESSLTQAVILAAGMDARAFRLDWPQGLVLFELDRDEVFEHKESVLASNAARPRCDRRVVRCDVSGPWTAALVAAGFDSTKPAAFLIEGLLFYLDEATASAVMRTVGTIACEGSWIGLDAVNGEMLTSPYVAAYMAKLQELGCPWLFGTADPERFLAGHGWRATAVGPGDADANYDRWPYPVIPRSVPGLPRTYLVRGRKVAGTIAISDAPVAKAQASTPIRYQLVHEPGIVGSFAVPEGDGPYPAVLALGGSDGGLPEYFIDLLVPEGFACLALGYFGMEGLPPSLVEVPLECVERGLRWLAAHPRVATLEGRLALIGVSRGGELALLIATTFPELVGPVATYTPGNVVWPGIDYTAAPGTTRSSWSRAGRPLPYLPYVDGVVPTFSARGMALVAISDRALDNESAVNEAAIPIERAAGPLLLISGGDDRVWAAERMCRMAVERMRAHGRADDVTHLNYPDAGHGLFPYRGSSGATSGQPMRLDLGGSAAAAAAAHNDAWPRVIGHLRGSSATPVRAPG